MSVRGASYPWWAYALLIQPGRIAANLERVERAGLVPQVPNLWQLSLGVLRMWHRLVFRTNTVGTSTESPVRRGWRAKLLAHRAIRLPFLLLEGAVVPLDLTGLASEPERVIRHLMGAHHDGAQFVFDLQILSCYPGALEELHRQVRELLAGDADGDHDNRRARWLRDLTVFERYHENLEAVVREALTDGLEIPAEAEDDADLYFTGYLRWCAAQPATPAATWQAVCAGRYSFEHGVRT